MFTIGEPVRVIARGNALPTSSVGRVVEIAEVDTGGDEPRYGFRYACRMVWGAAAQFEPVTAVRAASFPTVVLPLQSG